MRIESSGASTETSSLELSAGDVNRTAVQQIRTALFRNDLVSESAALQVAQSLPSPSVNRDVVLPTIDADAATAIKLGRKELYQIEFFDCCHEDGDIVEILVNGKSFAAVPIMHQGTMLSVPRQVGSLSVLVCIGVPSTAQAVSR